jgi:hypothetical protein
MFPSLMKVGCRTYRGQWQGEGGRVGLCLPFTAGLVADNLITLGGEEGGVISQGHAPVLIFIKDTEV